MDEQVKTNEPLTIEQRLSALEQNMVQLRAMLHDYGPLKQFVAMLNAERAEMVKQMEAQKTRALMKESNGRLKFKAP